MVNKNELRESHKIKILLKGPSGTGKSLSCVKIAEEVAKRGWKILYLDYDKGATEELLKLDDKILANIIYKSFHNYKTMYDYIDKYRNEEGNFLKLIIIDPMPLIEIARLSATDAFLAQGYYYIGEKKVEIDNKETFDLRGYMYSLPNAWALKFLSEIINYDQDIVCTLMIPNKHETDYDGKFSIVIELFTAWVGNQIFYKGIPKKMRGVDLNVMPAIDNPYKKLLEAFVKKYDSIKYPEILKKVAEKVENEIIEVKA